MFRMIVVCYGTVWLGGGFFWALVVVALRRKSDIIWSIYNEEQRPRARCVSKAAKAPRNIESQTYLSSKSGVLILLLKSETKEIYVYNVTVLKMGKARSVCWYKLGPIIIPIPLSDNESALGTPCWWESQNKRMLQRVHYGLHQCFLLSSDNSIVAQHLI